MFRFRWGQSSWIAPERDPDERVHACSSLRRRSGRRNEPWDWDAECVKSPNFGLVDVAEPAGSGTRRGALSRIKMNPGELPARVTRVAFLMGNQTALIVFGRDGLEARRAD